MNIITAFKQAVINCSNPEIRRMVQTSMAMAKERLRKEELKLSSAESLRNQKSLELNFLYNILDSIKLKLLACQSKLAEFSNIPTDELKRDLNKYEKKFNSILTSIERTEEEFSHILDLLNSCFDGVLNGPAN